MGGGGGGDKSKNKNRAGETEKFEHQKSLEKKIRAETFRENYELTGPIRGTV